MRYRCLLNVTVIAVSILTGGQLALAESTATVDGVRDRYVEALGGEEVLAAVDSVRLTGTYIFNGEANPFTLVQQRPDRFRFEVQLPGFTYVEASDGETTWRLSQRSDPPLSILDADAGTRLIEEWGGIGGPLLAADSAGLEIVGKEEIDGTECFHLALTLPSGNRQDWYLDAESHLPLRKVTQAMHPRRGPYDRLWYYEGWARTEGLATPEYFEREDRQHVRAYEVISVELNIEIPEGHFAPPVE